MSLLDSPRLSDEDRAAWAARLRADVVAARSPRWPAREAAAQEEIRRFAEAGPCYISVSWGKDSVVVAHLARQAVPNIPLAWVITPRWENPDCWAVRDAFLAAFPGPYSEYVDHEYPVVIDPGTGLSAVDFSTNEDWMPARDFGPRYVSGVRAVESWARTLRVARYGLSTANTCAPIGRWTGADVFAYLHRHDLPIHPAYAMSFGGQLDRERLRVAPLGGLRGVGMGRREWEWRYYREEILALGGR